MKPKGNCIFCSSPDISGEHIWPKWSAPLLRPANHKGKRGYRTIIKKNKTKVISDENKFKHGHMVDTKIHVVCQACNTQWMSAIENETKDIVISLMTSKLFDLTLEMQTKLAQWIMLKILVGEYNRPEEAIYTQEHRNAFKNNSVIPSGTYIFIGRCISKEHRAFYIRHSVLLGTNLDSPPKGNRNAQSTTIGFGDLFIFVMGCTGEIDLNNYIVFDKIFLRLWPISDEKIVWPPMKIIAPDQANRVAMTFEMLIQDQRTIWKDI